MCLRGSHVKKVFGCGLIEVALISNRRPVETTKKCVYRKSLFFSGEDHEERKIESKVFEPIFVRKLKEIGLQDQKRCLIFAEAK